LACGMHRRDYFLCFGLGCLDIHIDSSWSSGMHLQEMVPNAQMQLALLHRPPVTIDWGASLVVR